ncbi:unnamed protein product [Discosporangium mesarthrocarpum]
MDPEWLTDTLSDDALLAQWSTSPSQGKLAPAGENKKLVSLALIIKWPTLSDAPTPCVAGGSFSEVDLPEGHDLAMDDGEVDLGESMETAEKEENKWSDMGVDLMLQREGPTQPSTSNTP